MRDNTTMEEDDMRLKSVNHLSDGNLLLAWWANNKGRGSDNCTLAVVSKGTERATYSKDQDSVIKSTRTSSWAGNVNYSKSVQQRLGLLVDIKR